MVRLSIPAQLAFRDLVLSAALAAMDAQGDGPDEGARDEITSALSEAFNNVVIHAYRGIHGGRLDMSVVVARGEIEIQISDRGRGFDPASVPEYIAPEVDDDDIAALPESGMGIFIMRSFMDDVSYTRGGAGKPNVLVLRKRWSSSAVDHPSPLPSATHKKESSQSGWRMRSVAIRSHDLDQSAAGSLKRK